MSETKPVLNGEVIESQSDSLAVQQSYGIGRIGQYDPKKVVKEAVEMANALAAVIIEQKLYTVIKQKKYVHFEGWATLGGMLGIVPLEEYVREIEKGYEAKMKLIRVRDGIQVGAASSICTRNEKLWEDREDYAVRSMAITRATSKAYRMSYSWIIKLAGFDPTPIEEAREVAEVEAQSRYDETEKEAIKEIAKAEPILLTEWKEGLVALGGNVVSLFRSKLSADEKKALDIKLDDHDKVTYAKLSQAFAIADLARKYGFEIKWMEKNGGAAQAGN